MDDPVDQSWANILKNILITTLVLKNVIDFNNNYKGKNTSQFLFSQITETFASWKQCNASKEMVNYYLSVAVDQSTISII